MDRIACLFLLYLATILTAQEIFPILLTAPLFIIVAANLGRIKSPYITRQDMFWFCIFLFFIVEPCQLIHNGSIGPLNREAQVTTYIYSREEFVTAMTIVVVFTLAFSLASRRSRRSPNWDSAHHWTPLSPPILGLATASSFIMCIILSGGISNLMAPRMDQHSDTLGMLFPLALAAQTVGTAMIAASTREREGWDAQRLPYLVLALILLAVCQNPFNTPRFFLLAGWTPTLLALCKGRLRANWFYPLCLLAILILMPILSMTTRGGISTLADLDSAVTWDSFRQVPFLDAFDTLVHGVRYMGHTRLFHGDKTLAIVLFFVPRALWPGKPIVGGLDIGNDLFLAKMAGTPNLSFFVGGDLYMDFGFAAVLCGGLLCGYWFAKKPRYATAGYRGQDLYEYILIGSIPILVRGPLGAVLPLFSCQVFSLWALHSLFLRSARGGADARILASLARSRTADDRHTEVAIAARTGHLTATSITSRRGLPNTEA